jgi:prepilin-type N-terminal cleavage/methylation domain-containing protein
MVAVKRNHWPGGRRREGFTLLELLTVMVVVAILVTMLLPAFGSLQGKAELQSCVGNLKGLYTAASSYVQDQGHWPQIETRDVHRPAYAQAWIATFKPYGIAEINWVCPTVQRKLRKPDLTQSDNVRIDYIASPFDDGPRTAYKWPTHPWFMERGDVHGDGQMVIFTNSEVKSLKEIVRHPVRQTMENFP